MKYVIKSDNGYYSEDFMNASINKITEDIDEALIIECKIELTDEVVKNDFDLQWRLDTCKRIGGINPRFVRVTMSEIA